MKINWNFLGGGGTKQTTFGGGVWVFSVTAQCETHDQVTTKKLP